MCLRKLSVLFFMTQSWISFACSLTFQVAVEPWLQSETSTPEAGPSPTEPSCKTMSRRSRMGSTWCLRGLLGLWGHDICRLNPRDPRDGHDQKQSSTFLWYIMIWQHIILWLCYMIQWMQDSVHKYNIYTEAQHSCIHSAMHSAMHRYIH